LFIGTLKNSLENQRGGDYLWERDVRSNAQFVVRKILFERVVLIKRKIKLFSVSDVDTKTLFLERKMAKY
jgi:hypothetical protein